jgi:hypothetical protein
MTDEEANSNTALWPSEANIVRLWHTVPSHTYQQLSYGLR